MDPEDSRYALSFSIEDAEGAKRFFEDYGYVVSIMVPSLCE
jgi:hypothetical protein